MGGGNPEIKYLRNILVLWSFYLLLLDPLNVRYCTCLNILKTAIKVVKCTTDAQVSPAAHGAILATQNCQQTFHKHNFHLLMWPPPVRIAGTPQQGHST